MAKRFWVSQRGKKVGRAIGKKVRVDQKRVRRVEERMGGGCWSLVGWRELTQWGPSGQDSLTAGSSTLDHDTLMLLDLGTYTHTKTDEFSEKF